MAYTSAKEGLLVHFAKTPCLHAMRKLCSCIYMFCEFEAQMGLLLVFFSFGSRVIVLVIVERHLVEFLNS